MSDNITFNCRDASSGRRFAIVTLGCKVNQYEGQAIREAFISAGFKETSPLDGADVVVVNSCGVTVKSTAESRRWINKIRRHSPRTRIVATGCCIEIEPGALEGADRLVPQKEKFAFIREVAEGSKLCNSNADIEISRFFSHTRAFLKVQDGCSRRCSYCAVPIARGGSRSKRPDAVAEEFRRLSDAGYPEVVLCGVDLGAYGSDIEVESGLEGLVEKLLGISSPARLRLSSIDPSDVTAELLQIMASSTRICPHLHLPLQSGDSSLLKTMKRRYTPEGFQEKVNEIRDVLDEPGITTDCIAGFPGETDEKFENTLSACRACRFSRIHVFRYSPRPGTEAAGMPGRPVERTVTERVRVLMEEAEKLAGSYRQMLAETGRVLDVIVEERLDGLSSGTAARYVKVRVEGDHAEGTRLNAAAVGCSGEYVEGEVCDG